MQINLCNRCNMICDYCSLKDFHYNKEIDFQFIQSLLQDKPEGIKIIFSGGEPLLKFDLIKEIIEFFGAKFNYIIITNGLLLSQEDILQYIIEKNIGITISFDGVENSNRNCDNGRLFELIKNISAIKPTISMSVTKFNVNNIKTEIDNLYNINIRNIFLKPILDSEEFIPDIQDYHYMMLNLEKLPNDMFITSINSATNSSLNINFNGAVKEKTNTDAYNKNFSHVSSKLLSVYLKIGDKLSRVRGNRNGR